MMSLSINYFKTLPGFKILLAASKRNKKEQGTSSTVSISYASDALCIQIPKSRFLGTFHLDMKSQYLNLCRREWMGSAGERTVKSQRQDMLVLAA